MQKKRARLRALNIYIDGIPQPIYASFTYLTLTRFVFGTTKLSVGIDKFNDMSKSDRINYIIYKIKMVFNSCYNRI